MGVGLLITSASASAPSLVLFQAGGIVSGAGSGAIFHGSLTRVVSISDPGDRVGPLATFFIAAYTGLSIPVVGLGIAFQHVSPRGDAVGLRSHRPPREPGRRPRPRPPTRCQFTTLRNLP
jgi:hypothetical protein